MKRIISCCALFCLSAVSLTAQQKATDVTAPLHALQPDYVIPYRIPAEKDIKSVLDRVFHYLDSVTHPSFINRQTNVEIPNGTSPDTNSIFKQGDFRLTSYEWGVTYSGMLAVTETSGDTKYKEYAKKRLELISNALPAFKSLYQATPKIQIRCDLSSNQKHSMMQVPCAPLQLKCFVRVVRLRSAQ